jgi:deazaflavin-dependent oxidoreductase (nitroreductase family)
MYAVKRWMYRRGRPGWAARAANRLQATAASSGHGVEHVVTLEVRGRRSGRVVSLPVVVADLHGERYLVSMLGEDAGWVRNVQAAGGSAVLRHGRAERVRLELVEPTQRPEVLRRYLELAPGARPHIPVDRHAPPRDFAQVAARYPVFRVCPVGPTPV